MTREIFKKKTLHKICRSSADGPNTRAGDQKLADLQHDIICGQFMPYRYDSGTVNATSVDDQFKVAELSSFCFQIDDRLASEYLPVLDHDPYSPTSVTNPGRVISTDLDNFSIDSDKNLYFKHALNFQIASGFMISYRCPGHTKYLLNMEYHHTPENLTGPLIDIEALELAAFPFALAWMYRKSMIDYATLERYFQLLADLTPLELGRLRKYVNSPKLSLAEQASQLDISVRRYKESLYRTRDKIDTRLSDNDASGKGSSFRSLRAVDFDYSFLRMMGDHTQPILRL